MKKNFLFLLLFPLTVLSQTYHSWEGAGLHPNSKIRTLNIFINIIYDVHPERDITGSTDCWPQVTDTLLEGINVAATIPSYLPALIDTSYNPHSLNGTITRLYGESSFDSLQITGDFIVVNILESRILNFHKAFNTTTIFMTAIDMIDKSGFSTLYGHNDIADYLLDESIFFTNVCLRNISRHYGGLNVGDGHGNYNPYTLHINGRQYPSSGRGTIQCIGGSNYALNPSTVLVHEISHYLFGNNAFHTSGGNHRYSKEPMSFITIQGGYGLMGAAGSSLVSCNGYERWRMHWKHPEAPGYITARDPQNALSINSDISIKDGNTSFYLRDFVTYGDVIRINLPYKDSDMASNQYIWLENHQVGYNNKLDFMQYSNEYCCRPKGTPGIYAYYQISRDSLSGSYNKVWFQNERDNLKIIPAEGYWDYLRTDEKRKAGCIPQVTETYAQQRSLENPFCGAHDQEYQFFPPDSAQQLSTYYENTCCRKYINDIAIDSLSFLGDNRDAFASHRKINMSTNPSTCNAKTYYTTNLTATVLATGDSVRNTQTTYLTGLSIEMIPQQNHDFIVNIRWDDYDITNDARWTGKIVLKDTAILNSGYTITLAQNKTVAQTTKDSQTGLFAKRTQFVCEKGSYFRQNPHSVLQITENSCMHLEKGCTYVLSAGSELHIHDGCTLMIENMQNFLIQDSAKIIVDSGGKIIINGKEVHLKKSTFSKHNKKKLYTLIKLVD